MILAHSLKQEHNYTHFPSIAPGNSVTENKRKIPLKKIQSFEPFNFGSQMYTGPGTFLAVNQHLSLSWGSIWGFKLIEL